MALSAMSLPNSGDVDMIDPFVTEKPLQGSTPLPTGATATLPQKRRTATIAPTSAAAAAMIPGDVTAAFGALSRPWQAPGGDAQRRAVAGVPTPLRSAMSLGPRAAETTPEEEAAIAEVLSAARVPGQELGSLAKLRQFLACASRPPVAAALRLGALPVLLAALQRGSPAVQLEAAWALTNIAAGTSQQGQALMEAGVPALLFGVLRSEVMASRGELCEQCLWVLANLVAGPESVPNREALLDGDVLQVLGELYAKMPEFAWGERIRLNVLQIFTGIMSALCDGEPAPALSKVDACFDFFAQVVVGVEDQRMLADALWGLVRLVEGAGDDEEAGRRVERLLELELPAEDLELLAQGTGHPLMLRLVALMSGLRSAGCDGGVSGAAQRLLGALVAAPGAAGSLAAAAGAVPALRDTLRDSAAPAQVRCEAAWTLANLSASGPEQAAQLLQEPGAWQALGDTLEQGPTEARWEAAWAVAHVARHLGGASGRVPGGGKAEPKRALRAIGSALRAAGGDAEPALQLALLATVESVLLCREVASTTKAPAPRRALLAAAEEYGLVQQVEMLGQGSRTADAVRGKAMQLRRLWVGEGGGDENSPNVSGNVRQSQGLIKLPA